MPADSPWVDGLTIGEALRQTAERFPHQDALVAPQFGYRASYAQLNEQVDRVARALLGLGINRGEQIGLWATNWPQWVQLQFAAARVGAVLVTVNPAYRAHELAYVIGQSESVALFLIDRFRTSDYFAMVRESVPELSRGDGRPLASASYPKLRHVVALTEQAPAGILGWNDFLALADAVSSAALADRQRQLAASDAINIQYTSGTTGFPKGATLTHRNLLMNAWYVGDCQRLTHQDRVCISVPFYHCFGCVLGTLCCALYGAAMIVPHESFRPEACLEAIERERATSVYGVPTMFIAMLDDPTRPSRDLGSLRTGIMAGSPCPLEVMQRVINELGAREVTIAYGLTEAAPVITQTRVDDPIELRVQTVGRPLPGVEVKIADPVTGATLAHDPARDQAAALAPREVPPDAPAASPQGELCCRGHGVMLGYYNMPEQTARAIDAEGWLHSGDLATRLANGYYRITGRIKDMVCRGGENIYPREIEEFLYTHPAVQDVSVVGVPDPKYIEELAAWIRLRPGMAATEEEIRAFCKGKLAHYKIPRYIRFVSEFPQTVTGKIQKFKIREIMIHELHLEEAAQRETA